MRVVKISTARMSRVSQVHVASVASPISQVSQVYRRKCRKSHVARPTSQVSSGKNINNIIPLPAPPFDCATIRVPRLGTGADLRTTVPISRHSCRKFEPTKSIQSSWEWSSSLSEISRGTDMQSATQQRAEGSLCDVPPCLPHNIEAEQGLLGAILVNNDALHGVIGFLQPEHFFEPIHRQVYDVIVALIVAEWSGREIPMPADDINTSPIPNRAYTAALAIRFSLGGATKRKDH